MDHRPLRSWLVRIIVGTLLVATLFGCLSERERRRRRWRALRPQLQSMTPLVSTSIHGMVATGSGEATQTGVEILEAGGNAVDAAVAAAFTLGVADAADSGLGGTTFIVGYLADGRSFVIDGSSVVPMRVDTEAIAEASKRGSTRARGAALAATPGSPKALDYVLRRYGTMRLPQVLKPAIRVADEGYLTPPYHKVTALRYARAIQDSDYFRFIILEDGLTPPKDHIPFCRPDLGRTLRRIADKGVREFYTGSIADEIAADMSTRGGFITKFDLAMLRVNEIEPLRTTYRGFEVLTSPSPAIGGALVQGLNMLETHPQEMLRVHSIDRLQLMADTFNIAVEDHHRYNPDPNLPVRYRKQDYLTKEFAKRRAKMIRLGIATSDEVIQPARRFRKVDEDTTQVSVIDRWGNAVSLTQTLGRFYGSKAATPGLGFPYNSHLEGLQEYPPGGVVPIDLAPSIVLDQGEPLLVLGSAGSARVPAAITNVISLFVDRGLDLAGAVSGPRVVWYRGTSWRRDEIRIGPIVETTGPVTQEDFEQLTSRGYGYSSGVSVPASMNRFTNLGAVNAVHLDRETRMLTGVSDPRRAGIANGADY